ncbi:MAG: hypothetical protein AB7E23_03625 [Bacilli bacterium]
MMKKWLVSLLFALILTACGPTISQPISSEPVSEPASSSQEESSTPWNPNDLLYDNDANGTFTTGTNENRTPDDEIYDQITEKKRILNVGETYVEDFEKDVLNTKIYPYRSDNGATYSIVNSGNAVINGKSLYLITNGEYAGVYFNGMRFASNATYEFSFKYKIIVASNDFFIQFRSKTGGVPTDVYTTFSGQTGVVLTHSFRLNLGNYSDYEMSLIPRNNRGSIAIDDFSITRLNSKPRIEHISFSGSLNVGNTLTYIYDYRDAEGDAMKSIDAYWFVSLNQTGLNKKRLQESSDFLLITSDYIGKYIGISLRPTAIGNDDQAVGDEFIAYSKERVNNVTPNTGRIITLDFNQTFIETFEEDTGVSGNIYFAPEANSTAYITDLPSQVIHQNQSLYYFSKGNHSALHFNGIHFASRGIYTISFDYMFMSKGTQLYIQLRSASGGYEHDKYVGIDLADINISETYTFVGEFRLDGFSDYSLMIFPSIIGCEVVMDDLTITREEGYNTNVENLFLEVGQSISENFDDISNPKLGFDYAQVPNSKVTNEVDKSLNVRSLYFESAGNYKTLFINRGVAFTEGTYEISFNYKLLELQDTLYVQILMNSGAVFNQFGSTSDIGQTRTFTGEYVLNQSSTYLIQIFPGGNVGPSRVIIDDIMITRKG